MQNCDFFETEFQNAPSQAIYITNDVVTINKKAKELLSSAECRTYGLVLHVRWFLV